ncbi:glucosaminidase domain-containing protein [Enterococcus faecalis]
MKKPKKDLLLLTLLPLVALGIGKQGTVTEKIVKRIVGMDVESYIHQKEQHINAINDNQKNEGNHNLISYQAAEPVSNLQTVAPLPASDQHGNDTESSSETTGSSDSHAAPEDLTDEATKANDSAQPEAPTISSSEAADTQSTPAESTKPVESTPPEKAPAPTQSQPTTKEDQQSETVTEKTVSTIDEQQVKENFQFSVKVNLTTSQFIEKIGKDAQEISWKNNLYASVMIAQAILETGSGNSALSSAPNYNLFGIKGSYKGEKVTFKTQEDRGDGTLYTISSDFRKYPSYRESLNDYAMLLRDGLSGNANFYAPVWKTNAATYQVATKWLIGRYATDTNYNKKLNALIEAYQLTKYDGQPKADKTKEQSKEKQQTTKETKKTAEVSSNNATLAGLNNQNELVRGTFFRKTPAAVQTVQSQSKKQANSYANTVLGSSYIDREGNQYD